MSEYLTETQRLPVRL